MTLKLLVADDAPDVAEIVAFGARMIWPDCAVSIAHDGTQALKAFREEQPDLIVLDVSMPPPDGFEVCRRIRETSTVPILMLTVKDATLDKVRALDLGADDYLTKPFDHLELLARLRALGRRTGGSRQPVLEVGGLRLDPAARHVWRGETPIELTPKEFALLEALMRRPGQPLSRLELLESSWDDEYENRSNVVDVYVGYLRDKVDRPFSTSSIETVRGVGYRLSAS